MDVDRWVRRVSVAALLLLVAAVWFFRRDPNKNAGASASASASALAGAAPSARSEMPAASSSIVGAGTDVRALGERAMGETKQQNAQNPARLAADLPLATEAAQPGRPYAASARSGSVAQDNSSARSANTGPCGSLEVKLITTAADPSWAFASIANAPGEPAKIRHVGELIDGYRVSKIEWDRVWLQSGAGRCGLGMHPGAREELERRGGKPGAADNLIAPQSWQVPESIAAAIEKRSETEYAISREAIASIFEHASDLLSGLQLEARRRDERVVGLAIAGIPVDSLLERLGLQAGDIVLALDGTPCTTPEQTIEKLTAARDAERLVARLEREGTTFNLELRARR